MSTHQPVHPLPTRRRRPLLLAIAAVAILAVAAVVTANLVTRHRAEAEVVRLIQQSEQFPGTTADRIVPAAHDVCSRFDSGESWTGVVSDMTAIGFSGGQAGYFIGIAVSALCPSHDNQLP